MTRRNHVSRRHFLRGAAGITVGLPLLELFGSSKNARAQDMTPPKRVLIITTGFSMDVNQSWEREAWWASGNENDLGTLSPMLQPFDSYRDRLTLVGGINNNVAGLMESNGHDASGKTLLAPWPSKAALDGSGNLISGTPIDWMSEISGPSIDHYLAEQLGSNLLALSVGGINAEHRMRWRQVGNAVVFDEGRTNPVQVFDELFASRPPPQEPTPLQQIRARRGSVLDAVLDEFGAVRSRAGSADRERLDSHAELIRAVERDVESTVQIVCDNPQLATPGNWSQIEGDLFNGDGIYDDVLIRTMGQLSALALSCQATQVASMHVRNVQTNTFPWLNGGQPYIPANWHAVVHHDEGTAEQRLVIHRWYSEAFAEILDMLASTQDGPDSSLLDNTLVIWVSSLRHSSHSTEDLPVLMVGDLQGTFRTNRVVDYYDNSTFRSLGDLWTTVLNAMGVNDTHFGFNNGPGAQGRPLNSGPLTELFV